MEGMRERTVQNDCRKDEQTSVRRNRRLLFIAALRFSCEDVALAPPRADQAVASAFELAAQTLDIYVDHVGQRVEALIPHVLCDLLAADHVIAMDHQELQQCVLLCGQIDAVSAASDGMTSRANDDIGDRED